MAEENQEEVVTEENIEAGAETETVNPCTGETMVQ